MGHIGEDGEGRGGGEDFFSQERVGGRSVLHWMTTDDRTGFTFFSFLMNEALRSFTHFCRYPWKETGMEK